ncbi:MAG TPA: ABC transporter permease [Candidatus Sulfotelmatobacter sp.]|nr:ABC transporter permease [Candidatus Sulfotelmatobacter sp.]
MTGLLQDLRYAMRQLRKSPGFTAVAILTLALGIGANTAIFSVVHAVLLAPLPYRQVDRLVMVWGRNSARDDKQSPISPGDFLDWRQNNRVFEDLGASYDDEVTLTGNGDPKLVLGYAVSSNYWTILGVQPKLGRTFTEDEARSGAAVTVLSDKIWRSTFHADPEILGKSVTLDAKVYTVIGVMPPAFDCPPRTELWLPLSVSPADAGDYEHRYLRVIGRLRPGISVADAQGGMNALEAQIAAGHPAADAGNLTWVEPLRQDLSGDIRTPLLVLLAAVALVLVIACFNIASLSVARAASRRVEVSLRVAIGASRLRLLRQFLCESLVLSICGGAAGVVFAVWCTRFLLALFPNDVANLSIPKIEAIPIDAPVLWFTLGITIAIGLVSGSVPALQAAGADASETLKEARGSTSSRRVGQVHRALVAAEIALSLVLLAGGGLMVESFRRVHRDDLGFRPDPVVALEVLLPANRYPPDQPQRRDGFLSSVMDRLKRLPGAESAAATNFLPLTGFWGTTDFAVEGQVLRAGATKPEADNRLVTPGYFSTMGIQLLRGRDFSELDRSGSEQVAIVNSTFARRYFGGESPLNQLLTLNDGGHPERWRIVGVVSDVKAFGPEQVAHADLYRPLHQIPFPLLSFVVRATGDPSASLEAARNAIWDEDKDQPVFDAMPMRRLAAQSMAVRRTSTILLAGFAVLALIVAVVGLYGLMSYAVIQRKHEIGVRMALGAQRNGVLRLVVRNGMTLVLAGELAGLAVALLLTRLASGMLYGVSSRDPWTLAAAAGVLGLVALIASYIPARRAARVEPMVALRCE